MMHTLKKSFGIHKPSVSTIDNEFDVLYSEFNATAVAATDFLKAWDENLEWFEKQRTNLNQALGAVQNACGGDPSKPVVALQRNMVERMQQYVDAVRARPTQRMQAMKTIGTFEAACQAMQANVQQRKRALEELEYYRGKLETHQRKGADPVKVSKYEQEVQLRRAAYEKINAHCIDGMRRIVAKRDAVFHDLLAAFIDARALHLTVPDPYSELAASVRGYAPHLFTGGEWPPLDMGGYAADSGSPQPPPFGSLPGSNEKYPPPADALPPPVASFPPPQSPGAYRPPMPPPLNSQYAPPPPPYPEGNPPNVYPPAYGSEGPQTKS